jgi:hypothetical protein
VAPPAATLALIALAVAISACGSDSSPLDPAAHVVRLPGAAQEIDFDDIVYSRQLERIIVPARRSGVYLVDPRSGAAKRIGRPGDADSADEGDGLIFVVNRDQKRVTALDARSGSTVFTFEIGGSPDYVRYVAPTHELWVTEPGASPSGIEVFALRDPPSVTPTRVGFVPVPDGPEALTIATRSDRAYTHAGDDLVAIAISSHAISERWPTGCDGTHGFPQIDERARLALASCASDGRVSLLRTDTGEQLGRYAVGGDESLPAFSAKTGHFYARGDPGTRLTTLAATKHGLRPVTDVAVPRAGHCLTADDQGHYWTCDATRGRLLRFDDP